MTGLERGLLLRCPYCGKGKIFRRGFTLYEKCPVCGWRFEREEGYWTGAIAINLVVTELLLTAIVLPLTIYFALAHVSLVLLLLISLPMPILVPLLFFRHAKSLWMTIDFLLHPVNPEEQSGLLGERQEEGI